MNLQNLKRFPAFIDKEGKKVPIIDDWQRQATNDPVKLKEWYDKHNGPNFIWGIPTGQESGIFALDIDRKFDKHGQWRDGFDSLKKLGFQLPNTCFQQTRSGGYHLIFQYPKGSDLGIRAGLFKKELNTKETGLDTRGEGGWLVDYGFTQSQIQPIPMPQWLIEGSRKSVVTTFENGSNYKLAPNVAAEKIHEILETIKNAPSGSGNQTLNDQAFEMGRLITAEAISYDEALRLLVEAGTFNDRRGEYEATETAKSGLEGGLKAPLICPFDNNPKLVIPVFKDPAGPEEWTPDITTFNELTDESKLKQPQLFKDWSACDISLLNAEGGTGKTTMLLYESVCLRLGDRFLGFECLKPNGKTLYLTGEDTAAKLKAVLGQILKQMGILNDRDKVDHILSGIYIKKDNDMCLVIRDKSGVFHPNPDAYQKIAAAIRKLGVVSLKVDALANFWGPESQVNDMSRGVIKFADKLKEEFGIQIEFVHHLGADGSKNGEMGQFAGRGGSVIPSHSRVVKAMRPITDDERDEFINFPMESHETAMLCNVGKFSDGSPLLHKPFVIIRNGHLFKREPVGKKIKPNEGPVGQLAEKEILEWIIGERKLKRYPSKTIVKTHFKNKISPETVHTTLEFLRYMGWEGFKLDLVEDPMTPDSRTKVYVVYDKEGKEVI